MYKCRNRSRSKDTIQSVQGGGVFASNVLLGPRDEVNRGPGVFLSRFERVPDFFKTRVCGLWVLCILVLYLIVGFIVFLIFLIYANNNVVKGLLAVGYYTIIFIYIGFCCWTFHL